MSKWKMALNPDKSDAILILAVQCVHSYSNLTSVNVAGTTVPLPSNISILGAKLDSNLTHTLHLGRAFTTSAHCIRFMEL